MPEDEDNPVHPTSNEDKKETGKTCLQIKALRDKARALTIAENARLRGLSEVEFDSSSDAEEIHYESKTTNTEEVNKGIYFSYPSRRHSCALVNIPSPCVSKMIAHIEDVESKIQEHLKQFAASFEEWTSATKGEKGDLGVSAPEKVVHPEKGRDEKCPELKRKMESLLSEAIHLVKSLETDRAEAEQALRQQKSRKKRISMKIDSWSIWKLQELPTAVQKEYENYSKDIEELKLHLEDTTQQVEYLEKEKKQLEEANAKIQKDIDYMTNHRPLLEKKRKQEVEALKERYYKKFEVMELFRAVHEELKDSVDQCECTKSKLKLMKEEDEKDIFQEQINIELYKKELDELSSLETQYSNSIESASFDIEEDEETVSEAMRETESTTNDISTLMKSIDTLKKLFDQYLWKQRNSEKQYMDTLNNYYSSKKTWDIELSNVSKDFTDVSANYTELLEENKRLQTDIDKLTVDIGESIRKKMEYEEEIQSLLQEKIKNNVYLKQLYKQAYQIGAIYHVAKQKTDELEAKIADTRKKFKNREDFLKKLTRGEMTAGIEIQKRLYIIEETQFVEMQEFLRRRALYNLALSEVQFPLRQIEADAVRIRLLHRQHSSILHELMKKKEFVKKKVEATKKKLRKRSKKSRKELTQTEGKGSVILQEIEETKNKTIIFNAKSKELGKEIKMMEQEKKNYDDKLEKLKDEFITLRFDKDKMQSVYDHLRHEKQMCEERMFQEERLFKTFVEARQSALMNIQTVQDQSLEENLRLAKKYQAIQMLFLKEKDECLSGFDRLLSLSASLCDKKKLCQLQGKLDKNWEEYFRLVILFNQQRLDKFQEEAQDGIQKIILVQEESSGLMQHIVDFFQTLTDGACEKDD